MGLLTPEPGLIFWMIIIFGVVFFLLAKYGFPVIIKMVDDRKAYIDNSLKAAREANEKLANIQAESERTKRLLPVTASSVKRVNAPVPKATA